MKNKEKILYGAITIFVIVIGFALWHVSRVIHGETPEQIEARERANEAADQTQQALQKEAQWYNDLYYSNE